MIFIWYLWIKAVLQEFWRSDLTWEPFSVHLSQLPFSLSRVTKLWISFPLTPHNQCPHETLHPATISSLYWMQMVPLHPQLLSLQFSLAYLSNKVLDLTLKSPRNEDSNFYAILLYSPTYPLGQTRDQPQQASGMYVTG